MSEITPTFMFDFQRNLSVRYANSWSRALGKLWYQAITITQPSSTLEEDYEWLLDSAQIRPTNSKGSELDFEDIVAIPFSIKNENYGTALKLDRNSIEDNKYERAPIWAAGAANAGVYWPQRSVVSLIQSGKSNICYDGLSYFHASHPVNPYDAALGTFGNLFTAKPLNQANLAAVCAAINSIIGPHGAPRYLDPEILLVDPTNYLTAQTLTNAEIITDPITLGTNRAASATNLIKRAYAFGEPVKVPEFASEPGVWYVGVKADQDAMQGAFVYQERKAFEMNSYTGMTLAELDRLNVFEWHVRGRNKSAYGDPYLFFRCEPT